MMKNCFRSTVLMLAVVAMSANAHAVINLLTDPFDGSDILDTVGQTGSVSPVSYDTAVGAGTPSIVEGGGVVTLDGFALGGFVEFSPQHNFNTPDIEAAGGFTVELNDAFPGNGPVGGSGSWVGITLFAPAVVPSGASGNPLSSVYSFLLRDNGEAVVLGNDAASHGFAPPGIFQTSAGAGTTGVPNDIRLEVSISDFSSTTASVEAFVNGASVISTDLSGLGIDFSNNHVIVRAVDTVSSVGELAITIVPEPSSLMLAGLAGLALVMRRRK